MKRHYQWAGLLILFLLLAVLKGPEFFQNGRTNQWAIQVSRLCLSTDMSEFAEDAALADTSVNTQMSWLTGQLAHCQQKENEAILAWRRTLETSSERLSLVRAAAPHNLTLAQFATAQYPDQAEPFFWLGDAYLAKGEESKAVRTYEVGLTLQPDHSANAWMAVGRLYEAEGEWERAVYAYDQACRYVDQGKNGCPNAGRLYFEHEQYDLAAQRYRDAMRQLPGWQPARLQLAQSLIALGQLEEARLHLTFLADEGNTTAQTLLNQLSENQIQP